MPDVGDTFDRYIIEGILGEGGMGRVYRALDPRLGRRVALKVLLADGTSESVRADAAARMLREARAAAAFTHPNVVAIHDVGEVSGTPFITMELVTGTTLRGYVGDPKLSVAQKTEWLVQVARGLGAAHRAGLVHRDIKPDNVMVTTDGGVKILDFGIARRAEDVTAVDSGAPTAAPPLASLTADGMMIGTPQYMPPEQLQATPLDGRADQFAWGVMAWELFTGTLPWGTARNGAQLVAAVLSTPVRPLRDAAPEVPIATSDAVSRALSKERDKRFATMDELLASLEERRVFSPSPHSQDLALEPTTAQPATPAGALAARAESPASPVSAYLAARPATTTGGPAIETASSDAKPARRPLRTALRWTILAVVAGSVWQLPAQIRELFQKNDSRGPSTPAVGTEASTTVPSNVEKRSGGDVLPAASADASERSAPLAYPVLAPCEQLHVAVAHTSKEESCSAGFTTWCTQTGQPIGCCAKGLVADGTDGVCACPPGGPTTGEAPAPGCDAHPSEFTSDAIQSRVHGSFGKFRKCYEGALAREKGAKGTVSVFFEVAPHGDVLSARVKENSLPDVEAQRCLLKEFRTLKFPPPPGGFGTVTYPIVLHE